MVGLKSTYSPVAVDDEADDFGIAVARHQPLAPPAAADRGPVSRSTRRSTRCGKRRSAGRPRCHARASSRAGSFQHLVGLHGNGRAHGQRREQDRRRKGGTRH